MTEPEPIHVTGGSKGETQFWTERQGVWQRSGFEHGKTHLHAGRIATGRLIVLKEAGHHYWAQIGRRGYAGAEYHVARVLSAVKMNGEDPAIAWLSIKLEPVATFPLKGYPKSPGAS